MDAKSHNLHVLITVRSTGIGFLGYKVINQIMTKP